MLPYMQRYGDLLQKGDKIDASEQEDLNKLSKLVIDSLEALSRSTNTAATFCKGLKPKETAHIV